MKIHILDRLLKTGHYSSTQEYQSREEIKSKFMRPVIVSAKNQAPLFSLGIRTGAVRSKDAIESVGGFVFDFDNEKNTSPIKYSDLDIDYKHFAYTTYSNKRDHSKFRVIILLDEPQPAGEAYKLVWMQLLHAMTQGSENKILACDKSSEQADRNYYFPSTNKTREHLFEFYGQGLVEPKLSTDEYKELMSEKPRKYPTILHPKTGKKISGESRHDRLIAKGFQIGCNTEDFNEGLKKLEKFIRAEIIEPEIFLPGGERHKETLRGFKSGWKRSEGERASLKISLDFLKKQSGEQGGEQGVISFEIPEAGQDLIDSAPKVVKDLIAFQSSRGKTKPAFLISSAIFTLAFSKSRNHYIKFFKNLPANYANCYLLNIGNTGVGKTIGNKALEEVLFYVYGEDPKRYEPLLTESLAQSVASAAGLRHGIQSQGHLGLIWDEFGKAMIKGEGRKIDQEVYDYILRLFSLAGGTLMKTPYSKRIEGYQEQSVKNPFFLLMGTTTPGVFDEIEDVTIFKDGFMSRFTLFNCSDRTPERFEIDEGSFDFTELQDTPELSEATCFTIREGLRYYFEKEADFLISPKQRRIEITPEAKALLEEAYNQQIAHIAESESEVTRGLHTRFFEKTLSTCVAIAEWDFTKQNFVLDARSAAWAIAIQRRSFKTIKAYLARVSQRQSRIKSFDFAIQARCKVIDYLDKTGEVCKTELAQILGISYRDARYQKLIKQMLKDGELETFRSKKDKRIHILKLRRVIKSV